MVDQEDYDRVAAMSWHRGSNGYARHGFTRHKKSGMVYLHRMLLGLEPGDGLTGDHINRDKLDNRRMNLRVVTRTGNTQNSVRSTGRGASRFRGVALSRHQRGWRAVVKLDGKQRTLGYFDDELHAAITVARFRAEHMPLAPPDPELEALFAATPALRDVEPVRRKWKYTPAGQGTRSSLNRS
jgi:hypothetical protein